MSGDEPSVAGQISDHDVELIEQGRNLVQSIDSAQLRIGRLALEFAPMGERGYRSGAGQRAAMYAESVGLVASTLKVYRHTAHAWGVTDVQDNEFSFALLQALVSVGDKEGLLHALRSTPPPSGKPRWGTQEAVEFAAEHDYLHTSRGVSPQERKRIAGGGGIGSGKTPRPINLAFVGETLRKMSFRLMEPAQRETLDPLLAKVEAEAARLRRELNAVEEGVPVRRQSRT